MRYSQGLTVQRKKSQARDDTSFDEPEWEDIESIYATVEAVRVKEVQEGAGTVSIGDFVVKTRWGRSIDDLKSTDRLYWINKGYALNIESVVNVGDRPREIEILAKRAT